MMLVIVGDWSPLNSKPLSPLLRIKMQNENRGVVAE
jgi:hypothetical protein